MKNITQITLKELNVFFSQFDDVYSLKINPEKKEAYVQFKNLKSEEFLNKFEQIEKKENVNEKGERELKFFLTINKEKIEIEPFVKKGSLYIQNLPYEDFQAQEFIDFLEEGGRRKVVKFKIQKNDAHKRSWGLFKFSTKAEANHVFNYYQGAEWMGLKLEVFWVNNKKKNVKREEVERLLTSSIRADVTQDMLQEFFGRIDNTTTGNLTKYINKLISISYKKVKILQSKQMKWLKSASVFTSVEGAQKIRDFVKEKANHPLLGRIFMDPTRVNFVKLVPKNVLNEFKKLKAENLFNQEGQE